MRVSAKLLAHARVEPDMLEKKVALEDAVLFDHPVVGFGHERFQDGRRHLGVIPRAQRIADVVQQRADDIFLVFPAFVGEGRGQQRMLQAIHGEAAGISAQQFQMPEDTIGQSRGEGLMTRNNDVPVRLGALLHGFEAGTRFHHVTHCTLRDSCDSTLSQGGV